MSGTIRIKKSKRQKVEVSSPPAALTFQRLGGSTITIANRQRTKKTNTRLLKRIVTEILAELKIESAELGIHLVGANEMALVNWQFLQHKGSTDVITFSHSDAEQVPNHGRAALPRRRPAHKNAHEEQCSRPPSPAFHGELFVCMEDAVKQAKEFKTSWQSEIVRYVAHGILHLLGYDDINPALRRKMKREEDRLVRQMEARFSLAQLSGAVRIKT
jgi:probable rRNA maturation factor